MSAFLFSDFGIQRFPGFIKCRESHVMINVDIRSI